ncbi:MAG: 30S ribosomal protein S1 [Firmicutes bacterium]|jgi:small subunit ribosomal protein S1|nr:30S ribosomal protein S1 [Bacillota bacterium]
MEEKKAPEVEENVSMDELLDDGEYGIKKINPGDILTGKVISKNNDEMMVSIGYMSDGIVPSEEFGSYDSMANYNVDDEVEVYVLKMDDGDGNLILSKKKADGIVVWDELQGKFDAQTVFTVKPAEVVKGGVVADISGLRAFIPGSQLDNRYVENMGDFVGKDLDVKIIEFNKEKKKIVLSGRIVKEERKKEAEEKLYETLKKGDLVKGKVTKLMKYGAFVDIGGTDGLVGLDELSWKRVIHPSEVVNEGDEVEVLILNVDKKTKRIALSLKAKFEDPWMTLVEDFEVEDVVDGKVVNMMGFGAFVEIAEGLEGLVHISEISEKRITKPEDELEMGQEVVVKILKIDYDNKKISLSIKEAAGADIDFGDEFEEEEEQEGNTLEALFGDKLKNLKF